MKFNIHDVLPKIAGAFKGMDDEYTKLVRQYHQFFLDETRTQEAKIQARAQTHNAIRELKMARIATAKDTIATIVDDFTVKPIAKQNYTETERLYNIMFWKEVLPYATAAELRELWLKYGAEEDFMTLLKIENGKRQKAKPDLGLQKLMGDIVDQPKFPGIEQLKRFENALNALGSYDMWAQDLEKTVLSDLQDVKYRTITQDLDSFPIDQGATFRPVFRMGIQ